MSEDVRMFVELESRRWKRCKRHRKLDKALRLSHRGVCRAVARLHGVPVSVAKNWFRNYGLITQCQVDAFGEAVAGSHGCRCHGSRV